MSTLFTAAVPATLPAIDLRTIAPRDRHAVVFSRVDALKAGQSLQLLNDHDPQPLRWQLEDRCFGQFAWAALESGPAVWCVQITRVAAAPAASGSCCSGGACGG